MDLLASIISLTACLGLHARPAGAGECFDYATSPHWISSTRIDYPLKVAVQGNYAYVSTMDSALVVVDVDPITSPEIVARLELEHAAGDIELAGDILYLANDDAGLAVLDISNPSAPALLTRVDTPGAAFQVSLAGDYVYVADFSAGVQVIEVSNPAAPVIVANLAAPGFAYAVEARGTELLVGHGHGLMVADIANPLAPRVLGNLATHRILSVAWMESVACATAEEAGFLTIDVSVPQSPAILGRVPAPYDAYAGPVTVNGSTALVSMIWDGLWAIDCANPAAPKVGLDFGLGNKISCCTVAEGTLYAGDFPFALAILALGDEASVPNEGAAVRRHSGLFELSVTDTHAYLLEGGWIDVFDLRSSGAPILAASLPVSPLARDLAIHGGLAYLGLGSPGFVRGARAQDGQAWTPGGIEIVSIADLSAPESTNKVPLPQSVNELTIGPGNIIYALTEPFWPDPVSRLYSVDVADPAAPSILGSIDLPSSGSGAVYALGRLYVYGSELLVFDVSNPAHPQLTGHLDLGYRFDMEIGLPTASQAQGGPYAYLLGATDVAVVDLSAPDAPVLVGSAPALGQGGLAIHEDQLYAPLHGGFSFYDLTDADAPVLAGGAVDIEVLQLAVYPPTGDLLIATASSLERRPLACPQVSLPGRARDETVGRSVDAPGLRLTLGRAYPNPFRSGDSRMNFGYTLPRAGSVRLQIVDAAGRCVRRLVDATQTAGNQAVVWDGRNERGTGVASGVYFIRLESGGETRSERLLRLR